MDGYCILVFPCYKCGVLFSFHPRYVPSVRDGQNVKQPICQPCIETANGIRANKGLPKLEVHPRAYEPYFPEGEL